MRPDRQMQVGKIPIKPDQVLTSREHTKYHVPRPQIMQHLVCSFIEAESNRPPNDHVHLTYSKPGGFDMLDKRRPS